MRRFAAATWAILALGVGACGSDSPRVVAYVALDREYAEPILERFADETGIEVQPVYDSEATKTVGLANRLVAESGAPRCDVFWNNEILQTLRLKSRGLLQPYDSPSAADVPAPFRDPQFYWTGFAARMRVLVYNAQLLDAEDAPKRMSDLLEPAWAGKAAIANPLFGTTSTHMALLFARDGEAAGDFLRGMKTNGVMILDGNAMVRDEVARGGALVGLTDSDDAHGGILDGKPLGIAYLDQDADGTLVIPNTVALIADCPHPEAGKRLIDFLLRPDVEAELAQSRSAQLPVRDSVDGPGGIRGLDEITVMQADFESALEQFDAMAGFVQREFLE